MPSVPTNMLESLSSEAQRAAIWAVPAEAAAHLALRIGRGLLADGANASDVRRTVERVSEAFGHEAHALVNAEAVLVTVEDRTGFRTKLGRAVPAMAVDMDRLIRIGRVADAAIGGCRDVAELNSRLDAVDRAPAGHSLAIVTAGMALTAACLARLLGADWPVVAAALLAGVVSTLLRRLLARPAINAVGATFVIASASGLAGALVMRLAPGQSPVLCLTAAGMVLVPGRWHAVEEIEHKAVAFDLYLDATRDWSAAKRWFVRVYLMLRVTQQFLTDRTLGAVELLRQDGLTGPRAWSRLLHRVMVAPGMLWQVGGAWLDYFRPTFHPWERDDRALIATTKLGGTSQPAVA